MVRGTERKSDHGPLNTFSCRACARPRRAASPGRPPSPALAIGPRPATHEPAPKEGVAALPLCPARHSRRPYTSGKCGRVHTPAHQGPGRGATERQARSAAAAPLLRIGPSRLRKGAAWDGGAGTTSVSRPRQSQARRLLRPPDACASTLKGGWRGAGGRGLSGRGPPPPRRALPSTTLICLALTLRLPLSPLPSTGQHPQDQKGLLQGQDVRQAPAAQG